MKKLLIFSIFLLTFFVSESVRAEFVLQLPLTLTKDSQNQNDGYVLINYGKKMVVFCAEYEKQFLLDAAKKMGATAYNLKNGALFPVSIDKKALCRRADASNTDDSYAFQDITETFVTPTSSEYTISSEYLIPFAATNSDLGTTTNDVDITFSYFYGCPSSSSGASDNYYLTSTDKCSNSCPSGAKQIPITNSGVLSGKLKLMILCDDYGASTGGTSNGNNGNGNHGNGNNHGNGHGNGKNKNHSQRKAECLAAAPKGTFWNEIAKQCNCIYQNKPFWSEKKKQCAAIPDAGSTTNTDVWPPKGNKK